MPSRNQQPCVVQSIFNLCSQGRLTKAIESLDNLVRTGLRLDTKSLAFLIEECANSKSLKEGRWVHLHLKLTGRKRPNTFLSNQLIRMYSECGAYIEARKLFDKMLVRNLYSWNNMLSGYVKARMMKPARVLFDQMPEKDVVSWNTMVSGYVRSGGCEEALKLYKELRTSKLGFNEFSFTGVLTICVNMKDLGLTRQVHCQVYVAGFLSNVFLCSSIVDAYAKCGGMDDARWLFDEMPDRLFDIMSVRNLYSWNHMLSGYAKSGMMKPARILFNQMPEKDVVSWNTMVIGYVQSGDCDEALKLYKELRMSKHGFNEFTFAGLLTICVKLKELGLTRQVQCQVCVAGFSSNVVLSSSIVDAYAKCGEIGDARRLFDEMPRKDVLAWTTLVSGYAKWGEMKLARELFNEMPEKNSISWTVLISGYSRNGLGHEALELFTEMMARRVKPDQFTFSSCLCACASITSLKHGKQIHACLIRRGFKSNTIVVSSLIDMYSKCGRVGVGQLVFNFMGDKRDAVLWNTMISALAQHGHGKGAIGLFTDMVKFGVKPDRITFVVVLNVCSHLGLVQEGLQFFDSMMSDHSIAPDQEHYACLVDLLGQAGCSDEVMNWLRNMPVKPDSRVWNALLGICRVHGDIETGRKAAEHLI